MTRTVALWILSLLGGLSVSVPGHAQTIGCPAGINVPAGSECAAIIYGPWTYQYVTVPTAPVHSTLSAAQGDGIAELAMNYCSPSLNGDDEYFCPSSSSGGRACSQVEPGQPVLLSRSYGAAMSGPKMGPTACSVPLTNSVLVRHVRDYWCPQTFKMYNRGVTTLLGNSLTPTDNTVRTCYRPPIVEIQRPKPNGCLTKGNPCDVLVGNKQQHEIDYVGPPIGGLTFSRTYNSNAEHPAKDQAPPGLTTTALGSKWFAEYFQYIRTNLLGGLDTGRAYAVRPDGSVVAFRETYSGSTGSSEVSGYVTEGELRDRLEVVRSTGGAFLGWRYIRADETIETYNPAGRLQSIRRRGMGTQTVSYSSGSVRPVAVTDSFGHALIFVWGPQGKLTSVTNPAGGVTSFTYDSNDNLVRALYPDATSRTYLYELTGAGRVNLLTGLIDESGVRLATWGYDAANRVTTSEHAGAVEHYGITYNADGSREVLDPLGVSRTYGTALIAGQRRYTGGSQSCPKCGEFASVTYDSKGNFAATVDFEGTETHYVFDMDRTLEMSRTEAFGTALARTIETNWHTTYRLPTLISEAGRTTSFTYDADGNELTRTITDTSVTPHVARTWSRTYDGEGRLLTEDGPRTDVTDLTTYTYYSCSTGYECGQIHTITNALGHVTTFQTYNAHGKPLTTIDSNGVPTTFTYDDRQRLTSRSVDFEATTFQYWPTGLLKKAIQPDLSYVIYSYDDAQRLIKVEDGPGNRIQYTLDAMGNPTAETAYDPASILRRSHTREFNSQNQLWKDISFAGTAAVTTVFGYDNEGNQTTVNAPLGRNTTNAYDELNRLQQITDAEGGITEFSYDAQDNLLSVLDPLGLLTTYDYSGFGEVLTQTSPDSGITHSTYDAAGNLATRTDARGVVSTYTYDALNRVTSVDFAGLTPGDRTYAYDTCTWGKGRLCETHDASGTTRWNYTRKGRVATKAQSYDGPVQGFFGELDGMSVEVSYGYNAGGQLTRITMPSGAELTYEYLNNRTNSIQLTLDENTYWVLSDVQYEPFGEVKSWRWSNGTIATRTFDLDGLLATIDTGTLRLSYTRDEALRISAQSDLDNSALSWAYGYDELDRLISSSKNGASYGWSYDANGNRLTQTGTDAHAYTYAQPRASNRILSVQGVSDPSLNRIYSYDAMGNETQVAGGGTAEYDAAGRFYKYGGRQYWSNALEQRTRRQTYAYMESALYAEDGRLLGQYENMGWQPDEGLTMLPSQETIWLEDIPVAMLHGRPSWDAEGEWLQFHEKELLYVHADHLKAPRRLSRPDSGVVVWRWDSDPFGNGIANGYASGESVGYAYELRFPGQIYDVFTQWHYNYYRDGYDPAVGRYTQSDPIGLEGGLNTYAYSEGNPISNSDPEGLQAVVPWVSPRVAPRVAPRVIPRTTPIDPAVPIAMPSEEEREECEKECDARWDSDIFQCEWMWKMKGRPKGGYTACKAAANRRYVQCYQLCAGKC